jgi:hypothetical protein
MIYKSKMTRGEFLGLIGVAGLSLVLTRLSTLETKLQAIVPHAADKGPYGQSIYGI